MKILRVTSYLYPYQVGGIGVHTRDMSNSQAEMGNEVTVFAANEADIISNNQNGVHIVFFKSSLRLLNNTMSTDLFFKLFRVRKNYDIIHAHSHLFFSTNICAFIRKIGSAPLIITNHGIMSASAPDWFNLLYLKTIGKWTLKAADKIISYTEDEKEKLVSLLNIDKAKITVIPNAINTILFYPLAEKNMGDLVTILWVGRFVRGKGVDYLIHAMDILIRENPDLRLTLVGEGSERDSICKLIEDLELTDSIKIIDFVPYDKMPRIFQYSDIFVLPSLHEGVPRTVLEAMSCGLPIVISDISHLRDLIKGGGLMFPKKNVHALADSLRILINDNEKRRVMGNAAREKIIREYSWDRTVARTLDVYQEVLSRKNC